MPKSFSTDGPSLAKCMRDHLNSWDGKLAEIVLEDFGKGYPAMMLQQLAAAEKVRTYVNGSYIGVWNFAVYVRVSGRDTKSRLSATDCLNSLSNWLSEDDGNGNYTNLPELGGAKSATKITIISTPSIAERYDNGVEEYQAIFQLEYYTRR